MSPAATPDLSIVVSVPRSARALIDCLAALTEQAANMECEILVSAASPRDAASIAERFPRCIVVEPGQARCEPELLGRGVVKARGRIVAMTSAMCMPATDWVEQLMRMQAEYHSGVGGPVDRAPDAGWLGTGAYFATCAAYMPPLAAGMGNVSSTNASYKRAAIAGQFSAIEARGLWELDVNDQLRSEMRSLWREPKVSVTYRGPSSAATFSQERMAFGRGLGQLRAGRSNRGKRLYYIIRSPIMPFVYVWRCTRQVIRQKRYRAAFALTLPLLWWFFVCQVLGEFAGLTQPRNR